MTSYGPPPHRDEINPTLAARLVAEQFPQWAHLPVTPVAVEGWDNRTFRLGDTLSVRLPSADGYSGAVAKEQRWLPVLAPQLPLPIPEPIALGRPATGYPWQWSVYRWIDGVPLASADAADLTELAVTLAGFLVALSKVDATGGPEPGQHNWWRGGPLATYDTWTRDAVAALGDAIDGSTVLDVWETMLDARWEGRDVWFHGDIAPGNLLLSDGRLRAVIDFGTCGVGDPSCDLAITWTVLTGDAREAFRSVYPADDAMWARGRGWALWKALMTFAENQDSNSAVAADAKRVVDIVLDEHQRLG